MSSRLKLGLFGLPGAGKGTQAELLSKYLQVPHISTGDMFRALKNDDSVLAKKINEIISSGQLVPDEVVTSMALERLSRDDARNGFVLDGFPRTLAQAKSLQDSEHALIALIEIRVDRNEIIRRLSGRRICSICQAVYHIDSLPNGVNFCSRDSGDLVQRSDDEPSAVAVRLNLFESNFRPLVDFFKENGLLFTIDGDDKPETVFKRLVEVIDHLKGS